MARRQQKFLIQAVIFDMDGLLIDSEPLWREAEVLVFRRLGVPLTVRKAGETMGLRIDEVVNYWFSRYPWKYQKKKKVQNEIIESVIELIKKRGELLDGAEEILNFFKLYNIPIAIASSSYTRIIKSVLEKFFLQRYFDLVHSAEKEPYGKPFPGVYITTAQKLGIESEHCLVFEDSYTGLLAAKAARMKCIIVPNKLLKVEKGFCIADFVIPSLRDRSFQKTFEFTPQ